MSSLLQVRKIIFHGLFIFLKANRFHCDLDRCFQVLRVEFLIIFLISETVYVNVKPEVL